MNSIIKAMVKNQSNDPKLNGFLSTLFDSDQILCRQEFHYRVLQQKNAWIFDVDQIKERYDYFKGNIETVKEDLKR